MKNNPQLLAPLGSAAVFKSRLRALWTAFSPVESLGSGHLCPMWDYPSRLSAFEVPVVLGQDFLRAATWASSCPFSLSVSLLISLHGCQTSNAAWRFSLPIPDPSPLYLSVIAHIKFLTPDSQKTKTHRASKSCFTFTHISLVKANHISLLIFKGVGSLSRKKIRYWGTFIIPKPTTD